MGLLKKGAVVVLALGCSSEPLAGGAGEANGGAGSDSGGAGGESGGAPVEPVSFQPCKRPAALGGGDAQCATVQLPLRGGDAASGSIGIFVRKLAATAPRRGQLWVLAGGPGFSGDSVLSIADLLAKAAPELDVLVPDHRGTGQSERLTCAALADGLDNETVLECGSELSESYGERISAFRSTEAARDVAALIARTRQEGEPVFVHGTSYGGHWLHRLLQVAPGLVTAAVFDSALLPVTEPDGAAGRLVAADEAGRRVLESCAADADCAARLGKQPYARALAVANSPPICAGPPRRVIGTLFADALNGPQLRQLVPAFFYRAERCSVDDAAWCKSFLDASFAAADQPRSPAPLGLFSVPLSLLISSSELMGRADEQELLALDAEVLFNSAEAHLRQQPSLASWPLYGPDEFSERWATAEVPVLVMQGGLDPIVPPSWAHRIADALSAELVEFPIRRHGVLDTEAEYEPDCALKLVTQFLKDPKSQLDASCIEDEPTFEFAPDPGFLLAQFGTNDVWGDGP